jgi:hypothetical protein
MFYRSRRLPRTCDPRPWPHVGLVGCGRCARHTSSSSSTFPLPRVLIRAPGQSAAAAGLLRVWRRFPLSCSDCANARSRHLLVPRDEARGARPESRAVTQQRVDARGRAYVGIAFARQARSPSSPGRPSVRLRRPFNASARGAGNARKVAVLDGELADRSYRAVSGGRKGRRAARCRRSGATPPR